MCFGYLSIESIITDDQRFSSEENEGRLGSGRQDCHWAKYNFHGLNMGIYNLAFMDIWGFPI